MRRRVYVTVRCPTVPAWAHSSKPAAAGLLLWARWAGDIDRLLNGRCSAAAAGECGQCHAVSVCRKLNTDWFVNTSGELQKSAHNDANCRLQTTFVNNLDKQCYCAMAHGRVSVRSTPSALSVQRSLDCGRYLDPPNQHDVSCETRLLAASPCAHPLILITSVKSRT